MSGIRNPSLIKVWIINIFYDNVDVGKVNVVDVENGLV